MIGDVLNVKELVDHEQGCWSCAGSSSAVMQERLLLKTERGSISTWNLRATGSALVTGAKARRVDRYTILHWFLP